MVDITHGIEKFDIRNGAFMLASVAPYFPKATIHLAVVDPGVGTTRRPIAIETEKSKFVGPDNGLMIMAAEEQKILRVHEITNTQFTLPNISRTFHGRDIFAPVAAHVAKGAKINHLGPKIADFIKPSFSTVSREGHNIIGEIIHVDGFGNIITNIRPQKIDNDYIQISFGSKHLDVKVSSTYADGISKEPIILMGSHGFLEIALNQGSAAKKFNVKIGKKIVLANLNN